MDRKNNINSTLTDEVINAPDNAEKASTMKIGETMATPELGGADGSTTRGENTSTSAEGEVIGVLFKTREDEPLATENDNGEPTSSSERKVASRKDKPEPQKLKDYRKQIATLSYRDKLKEIVRLYDIKIDTKERKDMFNIIASSLTPEETEDYNKNFAPIHNTINSYRDTIRYYERETRLLAFMINKRHYDEEHTMYVCLWLRDLIEVVKQKSQTEPPTSATLPDGTIVEDANAYLLQQMKGYKPFDRTMDLTYTLKGEGKGYMKNEEGFYLEFDERDRETAKLMKRFIHSLRIAKSINLALKEFAEKMDFTDFLSEDILSFEKMEQEDYAHNPNYSQKVYDELIKSNEPEAQIQAIYMEDAISLENLFPYYDNVKPYKFYLGSNNIFYKRWQERQQYPLK